MNNKPVAWLIQTKTAHQFTFKEPTTIPLDAVVEPLYTNPVKELTEWIGEEEWEPLAWELCADEHGEESCTDLIWDMGVIPEPWGERWQKYEDEAKRMIAMVRKCTHPVKELTDEEIMECFKEVNLFTANMVDVARAILRKAQEK